MGRTGLKKLNPCDFLKYQLIKVFVNMLKLYKKFKKKENLL
jgi:hypothetical protein